ncbi:RusA family crossover junction endodeoxyribonuclease [Treponema pectinovorum]|uniref:RusA family crossover junction endodeoxyribonuclease n=1 Tax=Treponema pectinovorum TaxID=164 RepID=UPI0011CB1A30|nr:RusA family crossover junction endodeoxyribonuclease [Treponema pectinovorum]
METVYLRVSGETPAKKNSRIVLKNGRNIPSKRYKEWHEKAKKELKGQFQREPIETKVFIKLTFHHKDNRRRDSDNGTSSIFDLLQDAGVLIDDRWQIIQSFKVLNEKGENAFCEIEIWEREE